MRERYPRYSVHYISNQKNKWIAPQVFVEAKTRLAAQRVCDLISAGFVIIDGCKLFEYDDETVLPHDITMLEDLSEFDLLSAGRNTIYRDNVQLAALFASKMSLRKHIRYAALKQKLSFSLAGAHSVHVDPFYNQKFFGVESDPSLLVSMATAITLAYSSIEELQLEPRPFGNKPVKLEDGSWDPKARANLDDRLNRAKIDLSTKIIWNIRGSPTRIHKSRRAPPGTRQPWAQGVVRDKAVSVQDALVAASWIRSRCTTHRYSKITESISMYDVHNVQFLARALLMKSLGLWPAAGPMETG